MTQRQCTTPNKARLDGHDLRAMLCAATRVLERHIGILNALNVYPVPDGDTGTNMFLTMREATRDVEHFQSGSAGEVAAIMARSSIMAAKGNSGAILSMFFKGLADGLKGKADFGPAELAAALQLARDRAYRAVARPVEGTVLTVISKVAQAAQESAAAGGTLPGILDAICDAAREAVATTPTLLPVLREAGVVDAGGHGVYIVLEGFRACLEGQDLEALQVATPVPVGVDGATGVVSERFLEAAAEETYGYCIHFVLQGRDLDPDAIRERMSVLGRSPVVGGDETTITVHVHADDPAPVTGYAESLGTVSELRVQDMDRQHREYALAQRRPSRPARAPAVPVGVVAVAWGRGLEELFLQEGALEIVPGGDTMNPSVQEILEAVGRAAADAVVFLPNNRNIVPAANLAAELAGKPMRVVPSASIPQGMAALLAFNPESDLETNVRNMERELARVRTGEITRAVRPVTLRGVAVKQGQFIGLLERELVVAGDELAQVLLALLREAGVAEGNFVTLYYGAGVTRQEAESALEQVLDAFPGAEGQALEGGQPHYPYIVSID